MTTEEILDSVRRMSVADRMALIHDIWETVSSSGESVGLTSPQVEEYESRLRRYDDHPEEAIPWSEVKKRFDG